MVHTKSILERLLTSSSRQDGAPSVGDDAALFVIQISAYELLLISFADLEEMDEDLTRQSKARKSFADLIVQATEKFGVYVIRQNDIGQQNSRCGTTLPSLNLHPIDVFPHLLSSPSWLCEDKAQDAYVAQIDTLLTASDEFNCYALSTSSTCSDFFVELARRVGLSAHSLQPA